MSRPRNSYALQELAALSRPRRVYTMDAAAQRIHHLERLIVTESFRHDHLRQGDERACELCAEAGRIKRNERPRKVRRKPIHTRKLIPKEALE